MALGGADEVVGGVRGVEGGGGGEGGLGDEVEALFFTFGDDGLEFWEGEGEGAEGGPGELGKGWVSS